MSEHPIKGMMDTTLQRIREMVDASTVIGQPVQAGTSTVIPVSKISYGFASGGSDLPNKSNMDCFGGGGGAGVTISPVAFLVVSEKGVELLHVDSNITTADHIVDSLPSIFEKLNSLIKDNKKSGKKSGDEDVEDSDE